jgi:hypothetical protein
MASGLSEVTQTILDYLAAEDESPSLLIEADAMAVDQTLVMSQGSAGSDSGGWRALDVIISQLKEVRVLTPDDFKMMGTSNLTPLM